MRVRFLVAATIACVAASSPAIAQATLPADFADQIIVGGLSTPVGMAFLPDGRLLVTEQLTARIRLIVNGALAPTDPVVTVPGVRNDNFFRGLLGIAVDPRWPVSPYVYVHYASTAGKALLSRFLATGDLAFTGNGALGIDPASRYDLITDIADAAHNGGTLRFGPDQMLYASVGDSFFTPCAAQHLGSLRGVILQLEVRGLPAGSGGPPAKALLTPPDNPFIADSDPNARLVWARGLRNPFRFHVDAATGDVFVGDVGESTWEEIDRAPAGGLNFGWPLYEGPAPYTACPGVGTTGLTAPIHAYGDGQSVISAGVYRRPSAPSEGFPSEYHGDFFFSDYYNGALRRLKGSGSTWSIAPSVPGQPGPGNWATGLDEVSDYLETQDGSLWYCRQGVSFAANTGQIRRIVFAGVLDAAPGASRDLEFSQPIPNPTRSEVTFDYVLPAAGTTELAIFDLAGRRVCRVESRRGHGAGRHGARWDGRAESGRQVNPGIYLARLVFEQGVVTRRIVVID